MTAEERRALAKSILDNPLTEIVLSELETSAIESCINAAAADDQRRRHSAMEARAIRDFRRKLEASLQDNPSRKGAPA